MPTSNTDTEYNDQRKNDSRECALRFYEKACFFGQGSKTTVVGKTVIGKSGDGKTDDGETDTGKSNAIKYERSNY